MIDLTAQQISDAQNNDLAAITAVVQATEEAVLNALVANTEMTGRDGNRTPALPHDKVVAALRARGVIAG